MSLKRRIGQLEQAPALRGTTDAQEARRITEAQNLAAIRRRTMMMLEVATEEALAEDLRGVIAAIDEGRYPAPAPLPSEHDDRAKVVRSQMMEAFG